MSRSRQPRANHSQDADEEKRLWNQIKADAKKIDVLIAKSAAIGNEIVDIEKLQAALVDADKPSDAASDDKLEQLYRDNIRINETIQHMIEGESGDMNFLDVIRILSALRESAEDSIPLSAGPRSASTNGAAKSRTASNMARRKGTAVSVTTALDDSTAGDDSASVASPRVAGGRLSAVPGGGREKSNRGSSAAPSMREASVKIEDGAESIASSNDGAAHSSKPASEAGVSTNGNTLHVHPVHGAGSGSQQTPTTPTALQAANRLNLVSGAEVFYRNKGRAQEGEGILCRVTSVIGEGKQRRYEIQDADPDPAGGEPPSPYRASVSHLVAIPTNNAGLSDLGKGKQVLAQYPDTTTFYKAEVSTPWKAKDLSGEKGNSVRLRFEGEMEEAKETEVERRFVITDWK